MRRLAARIGRWLLRRVLGLGHASMRLLAAGTASRVDIWHLMQGLLEAKFGIRESLEIVIEAHEGDLLKPRMLRRWLRAYADGNDAFAREVSRWAPANEAMVFYALDLVLPQYLFASAARIADMRSRQVRAVVGALWMPLLFTVGGLGLLWACGGQLLPEMKTISPPERWGTVARLFDWAATGVFQNDIELGIGLVASVLALRTAVLRWTGAGRVKLDRFAPFSLYRILSGSAFLFTALEFLRLGVDLNANTFARLSAGASPYVQSRIRAIRLHMSTGGQGFGLAMKAAGTGFPERTLVTVAAALDGREEWELVFAGFVERWVDRSDAVMRAQAAFMSVTLMIVGTVVLGAMVNALFEIMGAAVSGMPS